MTRGELARAEAAATLRAYRERVGPSWRAAPAAFDPHSLPRDGNGLPVVERFDAWLARQSPKRQAEAAARMELWARLGRDS